MNDQSGSLPTKEQFSDQVDKTFRASAPQMSDFDISLIEFKEIVDNDLQETFSLLFQAATKIPPAQGIYQLKNDEMGPVDVFLVPTRQDDSGLYFEAIFNRLKEKGAKGGHS